MALALPRPTARSAARGLLPRSRVLLRNLELASGLGILLILLVLGLLVPLLSPYTLTQIGDNPFAGPSLAHPLGTDNLARDNLVRLSSAALTGLWISFLAATLALVVGGLAGVLAGYFGGWVDTLIMRATDVMLAIPAVLLALVIRVVLGSGQLTLVLALAVICSATFTRVIRAPILGLRSVDFVTSAEISGVRRIKIALTHLLPNALTPLLVQFAATASTVVLLESILSFLGQGIQPPNPSAGRMIADSTRFMIRDPWLVILPSVVLVLITIAWNLLADGLQRAMAPRSGASNVVRDTSRALVRRVTSTGQEKNR